MTKYQIYDAEGEEADVADDYDAKEMIHARRTPGWSFKELPDEPKPEPTPRPRTPAGPQPPGPMPPGAETGSAAGPEAGESTDGETGSAASDDE